MKNMPPAALEGPMAQQQKMMIYILPIIFAVTGVNFPIGVLVYWTVSNFWTLGQQFYSIRKMPVPGSQAEAAAKARQAKKAAMKAPVVEVSAVAVIDEVERGPRQRQQPMSKARAKKKGVRPGMADAATVPTSASVEPTPDLLPDVPGEVVVDASTALDEPSKPAKSGKKGEAAVPAPPSSSGGTAGPRKPKKPRKP
jgi:YidC/Oxa1 family membrane protein insertase